MYLEKGGPTQSTVTGVFRSTRGRGLQILMLHRALISVTLGTAESTVTNQTTRGKSTLGMEIFKFDNLLF